MVTSWLALVLSCGSLALAIVCSVVVANLVHKVDMMDKWINGIIARLDRQDERITRNSGGR